jgi:hypothetical protein
MSSTVGQIEKKTQRRVVKLLCGQLGYDYLGDWSERGAAAVDALPGGIKKSQQSVAETIENNVRKLIVDEQPINPKSRPRTRRSTSVSSASSPW